MSGHRTGGGMTICCKEKPDNMRWADERLCYCGISFSDSIVLQSRYPDLKGNYCRKQAGEEPIPASAEVLAMLRGDGGSAG